VSRKRTIFVIVLLVVAAWIAGCSGTSALSAAGDDPSVTRQPIHCHQMARWLAQRGGTIETRDSHRIQSMTDQLLARSGGSVTQVHIVVLDSDRPVAYAWPPTTVIVCRGLLESYDCSLVMAAVAHEIGHLVDDGHVAAPQALTGSVLSSARDAESRADDIGRAMLEKAQMNPSAMHRLLTRLGHDPRLDKATRAQLLMRSHRLPH
jgi:predicted Zn-dependent protease